MFPSRIRTLFCFVSEHLLLFTSLAGTGMLSLQLLAFAHVVVRVGAFSFQPSISIISDVSAGQLRVEAISRSEVSCSGLGKASVRCSNLLLGMGSIGTRSSSLRQQQRRRPNRRPTSLRMAELYRDSAEVRTNNSSSVVHSSGLLRKTSSSLSAPGLAGTCSYFRCLGIIRKVCLYCTYTVLILYLYFYYYLGIPITL